MILIINTLAEKLGDEVTKTVEEILKTSKNISAVKVEVEEECFFLEMDKTDFRILEKALDNGEKAQMGACCGQETCYVCERYGIIDFNRQTLRLEFFDKINPDDLENYTSEISGEIEDYFNDWISKYSDKRDQNSEANDEEDIDEEEDDEEEDAEEEDAEEEEVGDKVTKKVKKLFRS